MDKTLLITYRIIVRGGPAASYRSPHKKAVRPGKNRTGDIAEKIGEALHAEKCDKIYFILNHGQHRIKMRGRPEIYPS